MKATTPQTNNTNKTNSSQTSSSKNTKKQTSFFGEQATPEPFFPATSRIQRKEEEKEAPTVAEEGNMSLNRIGPHYDTYKGEEVNKSGKISGGKFYPDAIGIGMRIRDRPLSDKKYTTGRLKYNDSVFIKATNISDGWYFVVGLNGTAGWIDQNFVATDMPHMNAELHHVLDKNLTSILHNHYVATNKWVLSSGNDYRTLATAVAAVNNGRKGVNIDMQRYNDYLEDAGFLQRNFDPALVNSAIYHATGVKTGLNIWLPSVAYIGQLQSNGIVATRPGWMNAAATLGRGTAGFAAGIFQGFFGAIIETLSDVWELAKGIISTIGDLLTGEIFGQIQLIYQEFSNLTLPDVSGILSSLVSTVVEGASDFQRNWFHPDNYTSWNFRGNIVGNLLLEVVLAIFTGGAGNALRWAGRLATAAPRLARIIMAAVRKMDKILPDNLSTRNKRKKPKGDDDIDDSTDEGAKKRNAVMLAKAITEEHDAKNSPVSVLEKALKRVKSKFSVVDGFNITENKNKKGTHTVILRASKHTLSTNYTPKGSPYKMRWNKKVKDGVVDYDRETKIKDVKYDLHGHHTWPKFMGGLPSQTLLDIRNTLHISYLHPQLSPYLKSLGYQIAGNKKPTQYPNNIFIQKLKKNKAFRTRVKNSLLTFHTMFLSNVNPKYPIPKKAYKNGIDDSFKELSKK